MYIPLLQLNDNEGSLQIAFSPDNKGAITLKAFEAKNNTPAFSVSLTRGFDKFCVKLSKECERLLTSETDISIPMTINQWNNENKQYKIIGVLVLNKNLTANNTYNLVIKNNTYRHEFVFTMPNTISVGGEKMSEKEKSDISFEAFKQQVDKMHDLMVESRNQYLMLSKLGLVSGGENKQTKSYPSKSSFNKPSEPDFDFS